MYSSFREHERTPGDIGSLKDELSVTYATNEKMRAFDSARIYGHYQALFGPQNLKVFMLSVQVRELNMKIESLNRVEMPGRGIAVNEEAFKLEVFKNQINFNSGMLLGVSLDDLPSEEETEALAGLLGAVTRAAHPLFYTDVGRVRQASRIMRRARMAFLQCRGDGLRRLRRKAETLSVGIDCPDPEGMRENIKREIVRLRAEREGMMIQFPLSLTHRLNDPKWRMTETERLLQEARTLEELRDHLESRLKSFMN